MNKIFMLFSILVFLIPLAGCSQAGASSTSLPEVNADAPNQATENTAAAEAQAFEAAQATADAQAALDLQARLAATEAAGSVEPPTAEPTHTPIVLADLSEEEMVDEISRNVDTAAAAAQSAAVSYQSALADAVLSVDEVAQLKSYMDEAYAALDVAYALTYKYYNTYSALAEESLVQLQRLESDLAALDARLDEINATLMEVESTLADGLEVSQEKLDQLDGVLQLISGQAQTALGQAQELAEAHQAEINARVQAILEVVPEYIPADQEEAIRSLNEFWQIAQAALADELISAEELELIAQKRAEAVAGLEEYGGPLLEVFIVVLDELTAKMATGELQDVLDRLELVGKSLPAVP